MEAPTKSAVLLGTKGEPEVELCFGYHDLHPVTSAPLRDWVKALPNRRWNPSAKSWRVNLTGLAKGTLRDAGFTVTFLDGSPAKPSDLSTIRNDRAGEDFVVPAWFGLALDPYQRDGAERVAAGRFLLADTPGLGKGSPTGTRILTPHGWTTYGEVRVGDQVIGSDGRRTAVIGVYPRGELDVFKVTMSDGSSVVVDADHLWQVMDHEQRQCASFPSILSTSELMERGSRENGDGRHLAFIPIVRPVHFAPQPRGATPLDPYLLGLLLGDGTLSKSSVSFTSVDDELIEAVRDRISPHGCLLNPWKHHNGITYGIAGPGSRNENNPIMEALRAMGLAPCRSEHKFVPEPYLLAAPHERLELFRGLMDTDGNGGAAAVFNSSSLRLTEDVEFLVRSLGGVARRSVRNPSYRNRHGVRIEGQTAYRLTVSMPPEFAPFRLGRKLARWKKPWKYGPMRAIRSIEPAGRAEVVCIAVDAQDQLYVTEDFIVTHNTRQVLAVAAGLGPARVLILCPPVVLTHWLRETEQSGLVGQVAGTGSSEAPAAILAPPTTRWPSTSGDGPSMSDPPPGRAERLRAGEIAVIRPGRKEPELPERGVVIVPDTLVAARRKLLARLWTWQPELLIYDEAHRAKTWDSKRSVAARTIAGGTVGPVLVSTGTPMFAQPAEMVPLLDMTGQLGQVFGGRAAFVDRYLRLNRYRQLVARPERLPELRAKLDREVWVRRTKADVLRDLPPKSRRALVVDVDRSGFDAAHAEVAAAASRWLADYHTAVQASPSKEEILDWCRGNLAFVSSLRRAAGLCKVSAASEYICDWVQANTVVDPETGTPRCERPLVVWTHHREVTEAMANTVPAALVKAGLGQAGVIAGGTPTGQRSRMVDAFQAGKIPVLVGSITAAGVGITLTRSSDVLFTETDWTPGVVSQAEDRCHRKGQQNHVIVTTMVAPGTLDEPIQTVLAHKARVLDAVMPGDDHHVEVMNEGQRGSDHWVTAASLLAGIVRELIASQAWKKQPHRAA